MNTYRNCLLTLAMCVTVSFSSLSSASELSDTAKKTKPFAKKTLAEGETSLRFGRNAMIERAKLQRKNGICSAPSKTCECKTTQSVTSCGIRMLKRR